MISIKWIKCNFCAEGLKILNAGGWIGCLNGLNICCPFTNLFIHLLVLRSQSHASRVKMNELGLHGNRRSLFEAMDF